MIKLHYISIFILAFATACSVSKEAGSLRSEARKERKIAEQMAIRKAIESRQYVMKMDKIIPINGRMMEIVPRNNFIIVNGEIVSVSLAYLGPSFGTRKITGINFNGRTGKYIMKSDEIKGLYNIQIEALTKNNDKFDIYITLGTNGYCSASINNPYIQSVSYEGIVVPLSAFKPPAVRPGRGI